MKITLFLIPIFFLAQISNAQQITCSPKDKQAIDDKIIATENLFQKDFGKTLVAVGKTFLETPYVAKTLEVGDTETLVINLQGLDCTTFVENVWAFSQLFRQDKRDFDTFIKNLETIRYENGTLNTYSSRLHYFTYWIQNNESKGYVKDITTDLSGITLEKEINFMGTHRDLYPSLANDENYNQILKTEENLKQKSICYLPKEQIATQEHLIKSGDIIALATSIKGLDVTHTGIATREKNGRIHLLHASTRSVKVEVSKLPLADYLKTIKSNIGIIVARPY